MTPATFLCSRQVFLRGAAFAYMAACIGLSIAVSTLFRYRENSLLFLLWTPFRC